MISGNDQPGVWTESLTGTGNRIEGNLIGTDRTGAAPLGNQDDGVQIDGGDIAVGGSAAGTGNTIAHNTEDGVLMLGSGDGNSILRNSIFENGGLGIDLNPNGVTANDEDDVDSGCPNDLQNFPVLTGAQANSVETTVQGTLNSTPARSFRVEYYSSPACDAAGNGEGRVFLGAASATTDAGGDAVLAATLSPATAGHVVTATATDDTTGDTSEFSACRAVDAKAEPPAPSPPPTPPPTGGTGTGGTGTGGGGSGGGGGGGARRPPTRRRRSSTSAATRSSTKTTRSRSRSPATRTAPSTPRARSRSRSWTRRAR